MQDTGTATVMAATATGVSQATVTDAQIQDILSISYPTGVTSEPLIRILLALREQSSLRRQAGMLLDAKVLTITRLEEDRRKLLNDIGTIATELRDEAEHREWCDEYNEFVKKVNDMMQFGEVLVPLGIVEDLVFTVTANLSSSDRRADLGDAMRYALGEARKHLDDIEVNDWEVETS